MFRLIFLVCTLLMLVACQHSSSNRAWPEPGHGDDWAFRATYPTGRFDARWLMAVQVQHKQMQAAVPAGEKPLRRKGLSPLDLRHDRFIFLGPERLDYGGDIGNVAGRVNVIVSDPANPAIAYLGADGGGVWKTTNCCDVDTIWQVTTDFPEISSTAIGDLTMDPNDHNTLYAGTGDLRYGSYSFGSTGVLKTTNGGASWRVLGREVFNAIYEQAAGSFPQYQAIGKVRVDPRNSNIVVAGSSSYATRAKARSAILITSRCSTIASTCIKD